MKFKINKFKVFYYNLIQASNIAIAAARDPPSPIYFSEKLIPNSGAIPDP